MKITRLQLTIEPWHGGDALKEFRAMELRVEAVVNGIRHTVVQPFDDDDFQSRFDYMMDHARREILRIVKAK